VACEQIRCMLIVVLFISHCITNTLIVFTGIIMNTNIAWVRSISVLADIMAVYAYTFMFLAHVQMIVVKCK